MYVRLIRPQPTLTDQCVYVLTRSSRSMKRPRDAQVSSAESLPHLSPGPICSIHTQRRGVSAARQHDQVLRPDDSGELCEYDIYQPVISPRGERLHRDAPSFMNVCSALIIPDDVFVQVQDKKKFTRAVCSVNWPGLGLYTWRGDKTFLWMRFEDKGWQAARNTTARVQVIPLNAPSSNIYDKVQLPEQPHCCFK